MDAAHEEMDFLPEIRQEEEKPLNVSHTENGEENIEQKYMEIETYLLDRSYPKHMKGRSDLKSNLRRLCEKYIMIDGVLHFRYGQLRGKSKSNAPTYLRVIKDPETSRQLLHAIHHGSNEPDDEDNKQVQSFQAAAMGGHIGRDKTLLKLFDAGVWWPNMSCDVREIVKTCEKCQRGNTKFSKAAPSMIPVKIPTKVWSQIGVDLCCLPSSEEGFVAICVVVDYFSKWVEAKPMRSKTAAEVAQFLYELICRHGCADVQINDQGREFCNAVSSKLHQLTGTKQRITSAYHPQANGLVERQNRTIQGSLLKVLGNNQDRWPEALNGVLFAFRTARHKSTGHTPFEMMYGRKAVLPIENQFFPVAVQEDPSVVDFTAEEFSVNEDEFKENLMLIQNAQRIVHEDAAKNIVKAQARQKVDYEKNIKVKRFSRLGTRSSCLIKDEQTEKEDEAVCHMTGLILFTV